MKNIFNLFFTIPAKIVISVIFLILSVVIANCQVNYFTLYKQDNESFINAITQVDNFDYESSHYRKSTVRKTVESITLICMQYSDIFSGESSAEELLSHYNSIGDSGFTDAYAHLSGMNELHFALVNHDRKKVYSNITKINGKDSSADVRKYFTQADNTLLIARSCLNPYFATDTFIDFAEDIRACAEKYNENFDLYISFGDGKTVKERQTVCERLHFDMRKKIEKLNDTVIIHLVLLIFCAAILLTVTGKQEKGGKTYPTIMNRLPNDLILLMYGIVMSCLSSLFRTSIYMLLAHGHELDEFWFTHSESFYTNRIRFCIVLFICIAANLLCILKRQYKMGTLFKNTYISTCITNVKKLKNDKATTSVNENQQ